jgi:hypothetical protein
MTLQIFNLWMEFLDGKCGARSWDQQVRGVEGVEGDTVSIFLEFVVF